MNKTMCPGQDTRFWQPGDIFNSRCGNCGNVLEFFKDDASQRCKKCGTKVQNPKLNMGCAQWCEHAKECLGYDPKDRDNAEAMSESLGFDMSIADRILAEIKLKFGEASDFYREASGFREKAEMMIDIQGGKPRIIIPAAMLCNSRDHEGAMKSRIDSGDGVTGVARIILKDAGLDAVSIDEVTDIIRALHDNTVLDSNEYRVVTSAVGKAPVHK